VRQCGRLPLILKPEDVRPRWHCIENQPTFTMPPATDDATCLILAEAGGAELQLKFMELSPGGDLHDDINVIGRAHRRRGRVSDPEPNSCTADEHDLVDELTEGRDRDFQQLDVHD